MIKIIKVIRLKSIIKQVLIVILILLVTLMFQDSIKISKATSNTNELNNKYKILVDVELSKLYLFNNEELIKTYKCSGGKSTTPSPIGTWKITNKAKWGEGFGRKVYGNKCALG